MMKKQKVELRPFQMNRTAIQRGSSIVCSELPRRRFLRGGATLAALSLSDGRTPFAFVRKPSSKLQSTPPGPLIEATLTVTPISTGTTRPAFAGFSLEKDAVSVRLLSTSNSYAVGRYKRLGLSILRLGGDTVDKSIYSRRRWHTLLDALVGRFTRRNRLRGTEANWPQLGYRQQRCIPESSPDS
jgi:hypothetical protein